jgi:hypothetical protein
MRVMRHAHPARADGPGAKREAAAGECHAGEAEEVVRPLRRRGLPAAVPTRCAPFRHDSWRLSSNSALVSSIRRNPLAYTRYGRHSSFRPVPASSGESASR